VVDAARERAEKRKAAPKIATTKSKQQARKVKASPASKATYNSSTQAKRVTDDMFIEAAHAVADQVTSEQLKLGMLFPPQSNILEVEIETAARVAKLVFDSGLARVERPDDMVAFIRQHVYKPVYQISSDKAASSSKRGVGGSA